MLIWTVETLHSQHLAPIVSLFCLTGYPGMFKTLYLVLQSVLHLSLVISIIFGFTEDLNASIGAFQDIQHHLLCHHPTSFSLPSSNHPWNLDKPSRLTLRMQVSSIIMDHTRKTIFGGLWALMVAPWRKVLYSTTI